MSSSVVSKLAFKKHNTALGHAQTVGNIYEPTRMSGRPKSVILEVHGQGTVSFNIEKRTPSRQSSFMNNPGTGVIQLKNQSMSIFDVNIQNSEINLRGHESWRFKTTVSPGLKSMNLLHFDEASKYIWVSIHKSEYFIKIGHGYMLESNVLARFEPKSDSDRDHCFQAIKQIMKIKLGDTWPMPSLVKYWRLPVVRDPPCAIGEHTNLASLNSNVSITADWLPVEVQRLCSSIRNSQLCLNDDQIKWINYSMKTQDCSLHNTLAVKERRSNASISTKTSYIRVGMGHDVGDSIGSPFVLEIWPVGHESSIHGHGNAAAVIKVLHGSIEVSFYNPLVTENNQENQQPIKTIVLKKGDITWMTPEFYQTHKLRNIRQDTMSATIQCYSYLGIDTEHVEHFEYLSTIDQKLHVFQPRSDYGFEKLMTTVEEEYTQRSPKVSTKKIYRLFCGVSATMVKD